MSMPDYQECMLPLLKIASDRDGHSIQDAIQEIADLFKPTEEER